MVSFIFRLLALLPVCLFVHAVAQTDDSGWELQRETDGVQVFTRPQGAGIMHEVKGVINVAGNIDSAFQIFSDWPRLNKTSPSVTETVILSRTNENEYFICERIKTPFFLADREVVSRINLSNTTKKGYILMATAVPDLIPEKVGIVRMQDVRTVISLRPLDDQNFEIQYKIKISDTQGLIQLSVANRIGIEATFERMKRLRSMATAKVLAGN